MKSYDTYKDSGVDWIGRIPSHWATIALKNTASGDGASFIDGDWIESPVIVDEGIRYLTTGNVGALQYKEQGNGFISEETFEALNCTEVFPGDLLISRLNEPIGRSCIVPDLGYRIVTAVDNVIYRPASDKYDKKYLMYQMNSPRYVANANMLARGATMSRISRSTLGNIRIIVPLLAEQRAIAEYLDGRCSEIDSMVEKAERKVALLEEYRQSVITEAVTHGLNPDAPLRPSSIDWLGEIPQHWGIISMKYYFYMKGRIGWQGLKADEFIDEGPFLVTGTDFENGKVVWERCYHISEERFNEAPEIHVLKGDLLITKDGTVGKLAYIDDKPEKVSLNSHLLILRPLKDFISSRYIYWAFQSTPFDIYKGLAQSGSIMESLSQEKIGNYRLSLPPLAEQQDIAAYLDEKCAKIDAQIAVAKRRIELLKELKQTVISDAITGKVKVTND